MTTNSGVCNPLVRESGVGPDPIDLQPLALLASATAAHIVDATFDIAADRELAASFAEALRDVANSRLRPQFPGERSVRGLRHAPDVLGREAASRELAGLHRAAVAAFPLVRWSEFYAEDDWSRSFLCDFANGEGIGPDGRLYHDSIILGLFLLGPDTVYPAHAHPAEEFYIVLRGHPEFQVGADNPYVRHEPGSIILHHENVSHSIRTHGEVFFGVFGWRGAIGRRSWYRDDMREPSLPVRHPTIAKS